MPTFSSRSPSVSQGIAQFLGSSPNLTAKDYLDVERGVSTIEHSRAATDKIRAELEAERAAKAFRENPTNARGLAAAQAGVPVQQVEHQQRYLQGEVVPNLVANDDEGNPLPAAPYAPAPGATEAQRGAINASLASTILNQLATGKSSAGNLAQAFARQQAAGMARGASEVGVPVERQNQQNAAATGKIQEPFATNAQGTVLNQVTGALNEQGPLAQAVRENIAAQAGQRGAAAGLAGTRAADITATQASRIARNERTGGGGGITPQKLQTSIDVRAEKEYKFAQDAIKAWEGKSAREQKLVPRPAAPDLKAIRKDVEARYRGGKEGPEAELARAMTAISNGANPAEVSKRYKEKMGIDMPDWAAPAAAP